MSNIGNSRKRRQDVKNRIKQETPELVIEALAKISCAGDSDDSDPDDYTIQVLKAKHDMQTRDLHKEVKRLNEKIQSLEGRDRLPPVDCNGKLIGTANFDFADIKKKLSQPTNNQSNINSSIQDNSSSTFSEKHNSINNSILPSNPTFNLSSNPEVLKGSIIL